MDIIIAERESLPNIWGSFSFVLDPYKWWGKVTRRSGACVGVAFESANIALDVTHPGLYDAVGAGVGYDVMNVDASATDGTGSGVYKNNAHVSPNSIAVIYWRRNQ